MTHQIASDAIAENQTHSLSRNDAMSRWGMAVGSMMLLPGIRSIWPMSGTRYDGSTRYITDVMNQFHLTNNNNSLVSLDGIAPYVDFNGTNQYLSYADNAHFDILATEPDINSSSINPPGLTMGGWFWADALATSSLMSKYESTSQLSYLMRIGATGTLTFQISNTGSDSSGTSTLNVTSAFAVSAWRFVVCRFKPSTELAVFVNGTKSINTASIQPSIFNSTATFRIGAELGASRFLNGRAALCFLCASALNDRLIFSLYHQSRALFRV